MAPEPFAVAPRSDLRHEGGASGASNVRSMRASSAAVIGILLAASLPAAAGAAAHPRGSAAAGHSWANEAPQWPSLLAGYGGVRPPFAVPAVDYYVGVPAGVLKDPTAPGALPVCATYEPSFHAVLVGASNCLLDRYDFTKGGGLQVQVPNGVSNTTIERSRFGLTGNAPFSTSLLDFRGSGLTVTNSTFAGIGQDPAYFDTGASGTISFVHDYFYDLSGTDSTSAARSSSSSSTTRSCSSG